jgi:hypothetical protein
LPSWIRIRNLNADPDTDPATQINADPEPKPCMMQEMVRNAMKNRASKAYRHLVNACLSQPVDRGKDIFYDGDAPKGGAAGLRRTGRALIQLRRALEAVFQRHGAVPLEAGLRIRIHFFIRIRIQHFRLNTDPDPGL